MSGADGALVVGGARPVRRADLDEPRAGAGEHVGDAEAVADLDQLAARDDHLAALGERGEREQHRAGVVVDDERRLGAGQPAQDARRRDPGASRARRRRGRTRGSSSRAPISSTRSSAARGSGARPRFVWTITPVAFSDAAQRGRRAAVSSSRSRAAQIARLGAGADLLARPREHDRGPRRRRAGRRASRASSSTEGRSRSFIRRPCSGDRSSRGRA